MYSPLDVHGGLAAAGRLPTLCRAGLRISAWELAFLATCGLGAAAATAYIDVLKRVPGHSILLAVFPMALGLAVVPRRGAGCAMGISAVLGLGSLQFGGLAHVGLGAVTSMSLTGPMLDLALHRVSRGGRLYLRLVGAALGTNLLALLVRATLKLLTADASGRRLAEWLPEALCTYTLCGAAAGLVSALVCFHGRAGGAADLESRL